MWYYQEESTAKGPIPHFEIVEFIKSGQLSAHTKVWKEGMNGWKDVADTSLNEFLPEDEYVPTPPPILPTTGVPVFSQGEIGRIKYGFHAIWISLVIMIFIAGNSYDKVQQKFNSDFVGIGFLTPLFYFIYLTYKFWSVLPREKARTTPFKAAFLLLIPVFNLFWIYIAFYGLAQDLKAYLGELGFSRHAKINVNISLSACVLCSLFFITAVPLNNYRMNHANVPDNLILTWGGLLVTSVICLFISFRQMKNAVVLVGQSINSAEPVDIVDHVDSDTSVPFQETSVQTPPETTEPTYQYRKDYRKRD